MPTRVVDIADGGRQVGTIHIESNYRPIVGGKEARPARG
jgi:hypothetical protein